MSTAVHRPSFLQPGHVGSNAGLPQTDRQTDELLTAACAVADNREYIIVCWDREASLWDVGYKLGWNVGGGGREGRVGVGVGERDGWG